MNKLTFVLCTLAIVFGVLAILAHSEQQAAGDPLHGTLVIGYDDGQIMVCPLHDAAFDGTGGIVASVTTCRPDEVFDNGFE